MGFFNDNIMSFKKNESSIEELLLLLEKLSTQGLIRELEEDSSYWVRRFLIGDEIVLNVDRINDAIIYFKIVFPNNYYRRDYFYIENEEKLFNSISAELKKILLFNIDLFF